MHLAMQSNKIGLSTEPRDVPIEYVEPRWYAAHTCANHEKRVAAGLGAQAIEHFLPLYSSVRRWNDRRVRLDLPLFPGYVFVRLALSDRLRVLQFPGVARLVGFGGAPTPLDDSEVEAIRACLERGVSAAPHPFLTTGKHVRIRTGPLTGLEGTLIRRKGSSRVVLSLDLIARSIIVDIGAADLELIPTDVQSLQGSFSGGPVAATPARAPRLPRSSFWRKEAHR